MTELEAIKAAVSLIERLNYAFYAAGTSKALKPVMAETKPLLVELRSLIAGK